MSLHMNWLAVQGGDPDALLTRLGLRKTGWVSNELRARLACAVLPNGWIVIVSRSYTLDLKTLLPAASAAGLALGCEISDVVMYSSVRAYRHGELAWAVTHDAGKEPDGVAVQGEPPPQLAEIRAECARQVEAEGDEGVDFWFDAPVDLAKSVCGYQVGTTPGVEWFTLATGGGPSPARARTLREAIRAELVPLLGSLGWETETARGDSPNAFYSASRIRDGRFQFIYLVGKDDGREAYLFAAFAAWPGDIRHEAPLVAGKARPPRTTVWTRLVERALSLIDTSARDKRLDEIVAKASRGIVALDGFLTEGQASPDLAFEVGSAQAWLDALRDTAPDAKGG